LLDRGKVETRIDARAAEAAGIIEDARILAGY
jgi:hypothetical protein